MPPLFAFSCVALAFIYATTAIAQPYTTAVGIRLGGKVGISAQQAIGSKSTVELMGEAGLLSKQTRFTALLERHHRLMFPGLNFYVGAGPHLGVAKLATQAEKGGYERKVFAGVSALAGGELKLRNTLVSIDYKPVFNLVGGQTVFDGGAAISVRYIFANPKPRRKSKMPEWWPRRSTKA